MASGTEHPVVGVYRSHEVDRLGFGHDGWIVLFQDGTLEWYQKLSIKDDWLLEYSGRWSESDGRYTDTGEKYKSVRLEGDLRSGAKLDFSLVHSKHYGVVTSMWTNKITEAKARRHGLVLDEMERKQTEASRPGKIRRVPPGARRKTGNKDAYGGSRKAGPAHLTVKQFERKHEALVEQFGDVLGVPLSAFLRTFGPPDDKMQAGGVLMGATYNCVDGRIDVAVTEPPNQWVPWIRVRAPDTEKADSSGTEAKEPRAGSSTSADREREAARMKRETEARKKREAEEERKRKEAEDARRKAAMARFKAAVPGVYRAAHVPGSYLGLGDETDLRYELVLGADGAAGAALFVRGRVKWNASGTWELIGAVRHSGRGLRISFQASDSSVRLATRIEAGARWSDAQDAPLFGRNAGQDRPAGVYRIQGPFFGQDLQPVELVRTGGAPSSLSTTDPEELVDARLKQAAGKYVPTAATAKTLRAKYRGRVSYRLTLKKDGKFSLYYDIPRAKAVRMSGTWDWDGTTLTLRATKGNGRTLRRAKVDTFSFDGSTIDMDGIILERD